MCLSMREHAPSLVRNLEGHHYVIVSFLQACERQFSRKEEIMFPLNSNIYSSARERYGISLHAQILVYLKTFPFSTACSNDILFDYFFLAGIRAPISRNKKYASDK